MKKLMSIILAVTLLTPSIALAQEPSEGVSSCQKHIDYGKEMKNIFPTIE